jgi:hypothetical protein
VRDDANVVYRHEDVLVFEVHDDPSFRGAWYGRWVGAVRPLLPWTTALVGPAIDGDARL